MRTTRALCAGPLQRLASAVRRGDWLADSQQHQAADLLEAIHRSVGCPNAPAALRGAYLHGPVGSGKTALMDLLVESCEPSEVRRLHFHELMGHVHGQLHRGRRVTEIGSALGSETPLLCVDEMQITDIADAAILSRLTAAVCDAGTQLVITSNRAPEELYAGGLNRAVHIPAFCAALRDHGVRVHQLASERGDYRALAGGGVVAPGTRFHFPSTHATTAVLRESVASLGGAATPQVAPDDGGGGPCLPLGGGRKLRLEAASGGACLVSFESLCVSPLAAADYLTLARAYHTVAVVGVPQLTPEMHNEARRFISFLDVWYDQRGRLLLSAAVPLRQIFARLQPEAMQEAAAWAGASAVGADATASVRSEGGSSSGWATTFIGGAGDTEWSATGRLGVSLAGIAGLNDAAFATNRAASRLHEMLGSPTWGAVGGSIAGRPCTGGPGARVDPAGGVKR